MGVILLSSEKWLQHISNLLIYYDELSNHSIKKPNSLLVKTFVELLKMPSR